MKSFITLMLLLAGSVVARADDDTVTLPDLIQGAQQWAQENLDTNVLNALPEADGQAVRQFFREVQQRFQGDYVVDIATLRQTAQTILPLLESREETQPYAAWLKSQMDYLDVADEIRLTIPPPKAETNQPPQPVPNPPPEKERELWVKKVSVAPVAGFGKRICAGVEADFYRAKDSAGTGLGGGGGIVLRPPRNESGGSGRIISIDAGHGQTVWSFAVAARSTVSAGTERDRVRPVSEISLRPF